MMVAPWWLGLLSGALGVSLDWNVRLWMRAVPAEASERHVRELARNLCVLPTPGRPAGVLPTHEETCPCKNTP